MSAEQSWWRSDSLTVSLRQHRTTCPQLGGKPITGKRGKLSVAFLPALISPVCTLLRPLRGFPGKSPTEESARPARLQLYFVWIKKYLLLQGPPLCYYTFFPFATSLWFFPAVHILGDFFFFLILHYCLHYAVSLWPQELRDWTENNSGLFCTPD